MCNKNHTDRNSVFLLAPLFTMICCFSISPFVPLSGIAGQQQALAVAQGVENGTLGGVKHLGWCETHGASDIPRGESEKHYIGPAHKSAEAPNGGSYFHWCYGYSH